MRRLLIYGLTLTIGLLPALAKAQTEVTMEPKLLSLQEAMDYAVKHNITVKNARLDVLIQKAKNAEVTGIALPQLKAKGEFTTYIEPMKTFVPGEFIGQPGTFVPVQFSPKYNNTASATLSQVLFDGSVMVALQARDALIKLYEESAQMSEEEVRYNVQKAYYSYVIARRQYDILKNSLSFLRTISFEQQAMYDNGMIEKLEIDRINVQVNNLVADSIKTGGMIDIAEQLLKYQMGMDIAQPVVLTDTSVDSRLNEIPAMLVNDETDYDDRTDFTILQSQLKLQQYDYKRHRSSGLPSLAAFASGAYTYATNTFNDIFTKKYVSYALVGLQLNVPIFDGLQRHNRVKQARFNIEKAKNNIENLKLGIDFQVAQSKTTLKNAVLALQSQQRNVELATSVLDISNKKYKAGVGSNLEVTQAQSELLKAQGNYFNSMLEVFNAKSELQKARGQFK